MLKSWMGYSQYNNTDNTVEALVSNHLGNSEKWSQLELVAYENELS